MTAPNWPTRLTALDVSRGLAALSVVLWHWQHFAFSAGQLPLGFDRQTQPLYPVLKLFYEHGDMAVDYFFILSGFIFHWLYGASVAAGTMTVGRFFAQRFSRLYPLHLLTLVLVAVLQDGYRTREGEPFVNLANEPYQFLLHLFFASNWWPGERFSFNLPVWSVSVEVLLYAAFFMVALARGGGWRWGLVISLVAFLAYQVSGAFVARGMALFFMGGVVFHFTVAVTNRGARWAMGVFAGASAAWVIVLVSTYVSNPIDGLSASGVPMYRLVPAFTGYILFPATICAIALLDVSRGGSLGAVSWIGDITYATYLIHFPLQLAFAFAVSFGLLAPRFWLEPVYLVLFFALLVPAAWLTYRYFEMPAQRWLRQRVSFKAPSPA
ncbi:MAG: acyltransferase family protein [Gammaproteobacteria bacterium]